MSLKGSSPRSYTRSIVSILLPTLLGVAPRADAFDRSHLLFAHVLTSHVRSGLVDYGSIKADPKDLDAYLAALSAVGRAELERWSKADQLAFLINLYNAHTLQLIVNDYPVKSIKDIGSFIRGPWDQPVVQLFGERITLNTLEHEILRKKYHDPRIHFAVVCAALGCPPLRSEPYVGMRLDQQLDDQARIFLATPEKNRLDRVERVLYLSPIFKWYESDFMAEAGSVLAFVKRYLPPAAAREAASGRYAVRYTDYDWSLNDLGRERSRSTEDANDKALRDG